MTCSDRILCNKLSVLHYQGRDRNRNIKRSVYSVPIQIVYSLRFRALALRQPKEIGFCFLFSVSL